MKRLFRWLALGSLLGGLSACWLTPAKRINPDEIWVRCYPNPDGTVHLIMQRYIGWGSIPFVDEWDSPLTNAPYHKVPAKKFGIKEMTWRQ